jgi:hypothetical protein
VTAFDRRTFLLGAAAALVAGCGSEPSPPLARMARGVALGPGFVDLPEQRYSANRARFEETGTTWVRFWADWPLLQPSPTADPDLAALDGEIDAARADGLKVILTAWRFAPWANGTIGLEGSRQEPGYRLPDDLSPRSAWARWIDFLIARYSGRIDVLEIMNEPNLQLWPQRGVDVAVADMMETALEVASSYRGPPLLAGPATADTSERSAFRTPYDAFTGALLERLAERGFDGGDRFAWSHHNYTDVEADLAGPFNRVAHVRSLLAAGWTGRPELLVTESGARPEVVAQRFGGDPLLGQAVVLGRNLWRMGFGPEGRGVALVCQYLFASHPRYDSGLCERDGTPRPAYYAWAASPGV